MADLSRCRAGSSDTDGSEEDSSADKTAALTREEMEKWTNRIGDLLHSLSTPLHVLTLLEHRFETALDVMGCKERDLLLTYRKAVGHLTIRLEQARYALSGMGPGRKVVNLPQEIEETLCLFRLFTTERITLDFKSFHFSILLEIDPLLLDFALNAVLANAFEAVSESGGRIHVRCGFQNDVPTGTTSAHPLPKGTYAYISVSDTGCGMPPDLEKKAGSERFTTKRKGSGLGLMAVRQFVDDVQGGMRILSQESAGTTVCMYIPIHPEKRRTESGVRPKMTIP